ncbi:hypothetical protein E2C01_027667 [Portunus trituberculatus]|uniref:Uncharacterized protein n=1 Tax=Portunus trituberculatus TaxID=210409 RepID=A0A5B7EML4_PORTR|nr:hypothetical protein [Portunus trituberculatus]
MVKCSSIPPELENLQVPSYVRLRGLDCVLLPGGCRRLIFILDDDDEHVKVLEEDDPEIQLLKNGHQPAEVWQDELLTILCAAAAVLVRRPWPSGWLGGGYADLRAVVGRTAGSATVGDGLPSTVDAFLTMEAIIQLLPGAVAQSYILQQHTICSWLLPGAVELLIGSGGCIPSHLLTDSLL